jgi:hypothetical protein
MRSDAEHERSSDNGWRLSELLPTESTHPNAVAEAIAELSPLRQSNLLAWMLFDQMGDNFPPDWEMLDLGGTDTLIMATVRDEGVPRLVMAPVAEYLLERVAYLGKRLEEEAASA